MDYSSAIRCCGNICLVSRWLAMDFRSGSTIPDFRRHVTLYKTLGNHTKLQNEGGPKRGVVSSIAAPNLYSGGPRLESWSGHRLSPMRLFVVSHSSSRKWWDILYIRSLPFHIHIPFSSLFTTILSFHAIYTELLKKVFKILQTFNGENCNFILIRKSIP
jgi:hypothetical protein